MRPKVRAARARPSKALRGAPRVLVTTQNGPHAGISSATLKRRAEKMVRALNLRGVEISIAVVDDRKIHELNREYRRKDKPTDVLSFPLQELVAGDAPAPGLLGDVILSADTARRQAAARRRPLLDELTMLLAHGLLHLLGYDHRTDAEEREMKTQTERLELAARRPRSPR